MSRHNVILYLLKYHLWNDLKAMVVRTSLSDAVAVPLRPPRRGSTLTLRVPRACFGGGSTWPPQGFASDLDKESFLNKTKHETEDKNWEMIKAKLKKHVAKDIERDIKRKATKVALAPDDVKHVHAAPLNDPTGYALVTKGALQRMATRTRE